MTKKKIICIAGATSSGKTALSLELAEIFGGEIVNADARQIYRGFVIGTGVPLERKGIPHHLFVFRDPEVLLSVAEWREMALVKIREIISRGKVPILVGGTGLFVRSLLLQPTYAEVEPQLGLREEFSKLTLNELVVRLLALDPDAGEIVDLRNPRRVVRALEILTIKGGRLKEHRQQKASELDVLTLGIERSREDLVARAEREVDAMIERGWVEEVRGLMQTVSASAPAWTALGYREIRSALEGKMSMIEAVALTKLAVRQYIKRQQTWFKKEVGMKWVKGDDGFDLIRSHLERM